jgi:hypothetical protein
VAARWSKPRTVIHDGRALPVDLAWASRSTSSANTALPGGAGREYPAEQVQVKDQGDDE